MLRSKRPLSQRSQPEKVALSCSLPGFLEFSLAVMTVRTPKIIKYIWAAPASAVGAGFAVLAIIIGAQARMQAGVLEVSLQPKLSGLAQVIRLLPFSAITFGHVVLAATEMEQEIFRAHERVHVTQYERWGALFFLAYPAESIIQFFLGRNPYQDNRFEISARLISARFISDQSDISARSKTQGGAP